ncbi:hypothetical protein KY285_023433 [Solanum tuberosum]|nr:hypothetical protein KY289_023767 [Solanum tuberosum]KAH0675632.1 hypothetical protein KY285_023433 [Solanum tuberosum]
MTLTSARAEAETELYRASFVFQSKGGISTGSTFLSDRRTERGWLPSGHLPKPSLLKESSSENSVDEACPFSDLY